MDSMGFAQNGCKLTELFFSTLKCQSVIVETEKTVNLHMLQKNFTVAFSNVGNNYKDHVVCRSSFAKSLFRESIASLQCGPLPGMSRDFSLHYRGSVQFNMAISRGCFTPLITGGGSPCGKLPV